MGVNHTVPTQLVTMFAEFTVPSWSLSVRYITRFDAIPKYAILSNTSYPIKKTYTKEIKNCEIVKHPKIFLKDKLTK